jgi:1-aminocyclopropane-1-carboxylate deaminase/D-cysteine desulfhydrase-like pyridoxal-dependent ACC family enzyme
LLDELVGAEIEYIATRDERDSAMAAAVERLRRAGRNPFPIVLGASTPVGAIGFVRAVAELARQVPPPDVIVHVTSSAGTQAGLIAGCALYGLPTRVLGVSTDEPGPTVVTRVREILIGLGDLLGFDGEALATERPITVDDTHVGGGYGVPTDASREAQQMLARTEAIFVDHTYTAKAVGALLAYVRGGRFRDDETVMFWHTGGQVGLFA